MNRYRSGFTIVELLIVIVVIAILAAISVVAYTGIQNRANDTAIQADLNNFSKKVAEFRVLNERYPTNTTELTNLGFKASKSAYDTSSPVVLNLSYCITTGGAGFAIGGISKSGKRFSVTSQSGVSEYSSSMVNDGNNPNMDTSCGNLLSSATRLGAGYYSAEPNNGGWRSWTGS